MSLCVIDQPSLARHVSAVWSLHEAFQECNNSSLLSFSADNGSSELEEKEGEIVEEDEEETAVSPPSSLSLSLPPTQQQLGSHFI